jgi:hypothetical protein
MPHLPDAGLRFDHPQYTLAFNNIRLDIRELLSFLLLYIRVWPGFSIR